MNKKIALFSLVTLLSSGYDAHAQNLETTLKKTVKTTSKLLQADWKETAPAQLLELPSDTDANTIDWTALANHYGAVITTDDAVVEKALNLDLDVFETDINGTKTAVIILANDAHDAMVSWIESL